jgi:hypothetical protein
MTFADDFIERIISEKLNIRLLEYRLTEKRGKKCSTSYQEN